MGMASSVMEKGLPSTNMLNLAIGTVYTALMKKNIKTFEDFHKSFLEIFNDFNASLPGKHYDAPSSEEIKKFFEDWKTSKEEDRKKKFIEFINEKAKLSKVDNSIIITGLVTPPAAVVAKKAGEKVPQLTIMKSLPDVVFVPTITVLALVTVKLSKRMFPRKEANPQT